jgi:cell division protein FtsW
MRYFLPEAFSDFVYPVCIEEYGTLMGIVIVMAYLIIMYRGMTIAADSSTAFGGLLAIGLSFSLALQGLANIAVAVGIFPVTGLPLPFISMGGTSFLFTGITMGIINSVYIGNKEQLKSKATKGNHVKAG